MLDKATTLKGYSFGSLDGDIGTLKEFYFEDQYWTIRYLVADTGHWLMGRKVLLSPHAILNVVKEKRNVGINLTRMQIENSPTLESDKPVSRQFEDDYYSYYGWPGPYVWGSYPYVPAPYFFRDRGTPSEAGRNERTGNAHLRSTIDVTGHHIHATDGEIGHVVDFIIDDQTWVIRYLVVDTLNWWPGKKVLISPQWIESVSWEELAVFANVTRETIRQAPEYSEQFLISRDYETRLHRHYDRKGYWSDQTTDVSPDGQSQKRLDEEPHSIDTLQHQHQSSVSSHRNVELAESLSKHNT